MSNETLLKKQSSTRSWAFIISNINYIQNKNPKYWGFLKWGDSL
jgi:hypothetical protein